VGKAVFGIIGVGGIAQSQHLPNLSRAPHAFLKTACDLRGDVLRAMQENGGQGLAALDHFAQCVLTGGTPQNATARDGLEASRLAQAAIRSRETGEVIRFPCSSPSPPGRGVG